MENKNFNRDQRDFLNPENENGNHSIISNFEFYYNSIPLPIYILEKKNNNFIFVFYNSAAEKIYSNHLQPFLNKDIDSLFKFDEDLFQTINYCYEEKTTVKIEKHFKINERFREIYSNLTFNFLPSKYVLISVENLENNCSKEKEKFKEELHKLENELNNNERLASIGKMTAYLAHEIKTPISSIKMNLQMLGKNLNLTETQSKSFQILTKEVDRLNRLLKGVLLFSRKSKSIDTPINLSVLVNNIYLFYQELLKSKSITFVNHIENITIKGDLQNVQSVFMNLIENAIESINEDGIIEIHSTLDNSNSYAHIYVYDSGKGIVQSDKIFEPFYTTKTSGSGLGLPIAKKIMQEFSGDLILKSSNYGETIFELKFPLHTES